MKNLPTLLCLVLLSSMVLSDWLSSTQEPAPTPMQSTGGAIGFDAEEETRIVVMPPQREVFWDTLDIEDNRARKLLEVPAGKRFVLTDLWTMRHNEYPNHQPSVTDRVWLEDENRRGRRIVFDAKLCEMPFNGTPELNDWYPAPMHWESGVVFGPEHVAWFNYDFDGERKRDWIRRVHFSGYFEDVEPAVQ